MTAAPPKQRSKIQLESSTPSTSLSRKTKRGVSGGRRCGKALSTFSLATMRSVDYSKRSMQRAWTRGAFMEGPSQLRFFLAVKLKVSALARLTSSLPDRGSDPSRQHSYCPVLSGAVLLLLLLLDFFVCLGRCVVRAVVRSRFAKLHRSSQSTAHTHRDTPPLEPDIGAELSREVEPRPPLPIICICHITGSFIATLAVFINAGQHYWERGVSAQCRAAACPPPA